MSATLGGASTEGLLAGPEPGGRARVSVLDQALWRRFAEATDPADPIPFIQAWLGLQCRWLGTVEAAVVLLGEEPDEGPFAPVAQWPEEVAVGDELTRIAEFALAERRGAAKGETSGTDGGRQLARLAAYPFLMDGQLFGAVAVRFAAGAEPDRRPVMRQLQWGVGWIEAILRRRLASDNRDHLDRVETAFDALAAALEDEAFEASCTSVVTELALRLDCDQVSIGFVRGARAVVSAVSHAAQVGSRMNLVRDIAAAMDEAIDQQAIVLYPPNNDWDFRIDRAHAELVRVHGSGAVLTVPLHASGRFFGALTFERAADRPFDEQAIALCDCVATVVGPILDEKRKNDRWIGAKLAGTITEQSKRLFGPRYFGRKLAAAVAMLTVAFFATVTGDYQITSPAIVEGAIQRSIVAPMDGYIFAENAKAGESVAAGTILASLDDRDLQLERLRWETKRTASFTKRDQALAERERAEAMIIQSEIDEAAAQVALLDAQIERSVLRAPFDGIIISGDLSQSVGAAVGRGDELFRIAPLDEYRIVLEVDEGDIDEIQVGQAGKLVLSSMPDRSVPYAITRIVPISEAREGRNFFVVEAQMTEQLARLRPGMGGIGKTYVNERLLIEIWTASFVDWLRLNAWRWLP